jgi:hypothetical protein
MSKYRVMRQFDVSHSGVAETRVMVWREGLTKEVADQMAEFHNSVGHKTPKHPALVVPGENIFHEPDRFTVEAYEE